MGERVGRVRVSRRGSTLRPAIRQSRVNHLTVFYTPGGAARIRFAPACHPLSQTAHLSRPRVEEDTTMRIFIAGATGTLGRPVVRRLVSLGHEVVGLTRSEKGARGLEAAGARGVIGDALDREGLRAAVVAARPEQVLHLLTALPPVILRARHLEATNHLRLVGTPNLIEAAVAAGARRIVAESFVSVYGKV